MKRKTNSQVDHSLVRELTELDSADAASHLETVAPELSSRALLELAPQEVDDIVPLLSEKTRNTIIAALPPEIRKQWSYNADCPEDSVGRMMEPVWAAFPPEMLVATVIEELREIVKTQFITYGYVVDSEQRLLGVLVMRDLLFAAPTDTLEQIMLRDPFSLQADTPLMDAMREVLSRHYPVYPVVDQHKVLVGQIRGHRLFEAQAIEISAQAGSMVGVEKEEKLSTPWMRSFKYRHPWLQLNLLTAFVAGGVVSMFQDTINQIVVLAAFLPVLAGQSGNTGCQALAVTIRGMTLSELKVGGIRKLLCKEGLLGLINGMFVGVSAAIGMYILATSQNNPQALPLAGIVFLAMVGSCFVSGLFGALIPLALRRVGADPATASSIFLTTATDVASMGLLLALASSLLL